MALLSRLHLQIDRYAQRDLKKGLHLYGTPGNVGLTNAWSIIQTDVSGGRWRRGAGVLGKRAWRSPVPAELSRSSAAAACPTTRTGSRSTMRHACPTPAAWSSARAAGCTRRAPGGRR